MGKWGKPAWYSIEKKRLNRNWFGPARRSVWLVFYCFFLPEKIKKEKQLFHRKKERTLEVNHLKYWGKHAHAKPKFSSMWMTSWLMRPARIGPSEPRTKFSTMLFDGKFSTMLTAILKRATGLAMIECMYRYKTRNRSFYFIRSSPTIILKEYTTLSSSYNHIPNHNIQWYKT
jgi:hypothetical protein